MTIGERIKTIRTHLKLSQKELSKILNITQATLSRYENGELDLPDTTKLKLIYDYGISASWLLTGQGEMFLGVIPSEISPVKESEKDRRIRELEERLKKEEKEKEELKKSVDDLEKDCKILDEEIAELKDELLDVYRGSKKRINGNVSLSNA